MAIKIFLLGRPGSGKSTAARYIEHFVQPPGWDTIRINDYQFLREMFEVDTQYQKFTPTGYGGFDVVDFSVLDLALQAVENEARVHTHCKNELLLLEFARDDYQAALRQFQPLFLRDAYFLFFDADINTCVRRVYERSCHPTFCDDHFISEEMIRSYYREEHTASTTYQLPENYNIRDNRIYIIENDGNEYELHIQVKQAIEDIIRRRGKKRDRLPIVPLSMKPGADLRT